MTDPTDELSARLLPAYRNEEFLDTPDARPLRILSEYLYPLSHLRKEKISDTIVFFGSARTFEASASGRYYTEARQLANLLNRHNIKAKVNLIPHNPADPLPYRPSTDETVERFKNILESKGIHTYVRRPRGRDIFAACGQLAARQTTLTNTNLVGAN